MNHSELGSLGSANSPGFDTKPLVKRPYDEFVESAARLIPSILADVHSNERGDVELVASELVERIRSPGIPRAAAEWAVHEAVCGGRLVPVLIDHTIRTLKRVRNPMKWLGGPDIQGVIDDGGKQCVAPPPPRGPIRFDRFKVLATELLWESWTTPTSLSQNSVGTESEPASEEIQEPTILSTAETFREANETKTAKRIDEKPRIDDATFSVHYLGKSCELRNTHKFHVLKRLCQSPGICISNAVLRDAVWDNHKTQDATIQRTISDLRRHLKESGIEGIIIDGKKNKGHYTLTWSEANP